MLSPVQLYLAFREWPKNWESFIPDIIGASKTNESLCQNNMVILKLLSEEVFDFSSGQMTQTKAKHLKDSMCSQFSEVCSCLIPRKGLFLELKLIVLRSLPSASLSWITPTTLHWYVIFTQLDEKTTTENIIVKSEFLGWCNVRHPVEVP